MISNAQFGPQLALFPDTGKGPTRRLEPAEMTPHQFRTLPGAFHHGTYHPQMPTNANGLADPFSAGVHLGSMEAAKERLLSLGPRNESLRKQYTRRGHDYEPVADDVPGQIHTRRVVGGFKNSPNRPSKDRGGAWLSEPDVERSNYYRNRFEDKGGISIRVARDEDITSHGEAVRKALDTGGRVHPANAALLAQGHLDNPEPFLVTEKAHREYRRNNPNTGFAS